MIHSPKYGDKWIPTFTGMTIFDDLRPFAETSFNSPHFPKRQTTAMFSGQAMVTMRCPEPCNNLTCLAEGIAQNFYGGVPEAYSRTGGLDSGCGAR